MEDNAGKLYGGEGSTAEGEDIHVVGSRGIFPSTAEC